MGQRIREFDWSATSLGSFDQWSPALRTMVRMLLPNRFPQLLWWGPEYIQFYNDPYRPIPGEKHPHRALGRPASECWAEIWDVIGPLIDTPYNGGPATWNDDILLVINRHGYFEESHFTIAYSPVPDETVPSGIGGVLATVNEITEKVVADRRMVVLRDLGARAAEAKCPDDACVLAAETLSRHDKDVPFAVFYLIDPETNQARLTGVAGVEAGQPVSPLQVDLSVRATGGWPLFDAFVDHAMHVVDNLPGRFDAIPAGPWPDAPDTAVVVPIPASRAHELAGFLVVGISARLRFDDAYRAFLELMRTQVAAAIANARAYEEERKRAEALAALDRAKTQFFSNVSHEFRTPLTLMLGPVEDLLTSGEHELPPDVKCRLDVVHRNSLRLLRLVNTMLEFTRIEAGRVSANYEPVDLPALTADLASSFRSACERAGLRLIVNCEPLSTSAPAFVDRDMWEKIVLNLVSNAFKFTLGGEIEVRVESTSPDSVSLIVRDTGVGIPAEELPRMFDRFHRVQNVAARTHEGTGIGLALVNELVKLHGGAIAVESAVNEGSRFTVTLPLGDGHIDHAVVDGAGQRPSRSMRDAFIEEALRWIPGPVADTRDPFVNRADMAPGQRPRVLWADDNADMRQYVAGILSARYDVEAVADGREALEAAKRTSPDVVLTDVMMPHVDGFELLRELRATEGLRDIPVIMISARAGEESRITGLDAGADDYLIKPFSARELMARVDAHVRMEVLRKAAKRNQVEAERRKDEFLATLAHELRNPLAPVRNALAILELKGPAEPELRWAREVINRQMHQMSRLVDDLLDVSRISHGKIELKRERLELATVIHGAVEASRPLIEQNAHELSVTIPTEAIYLDADETRLIQVFCNLLNNAAKYSESRGRIAISAVRENHDVVVTVRDTGFGIPQDVLPRVFDMFTQADPTMERSKSGLGVGLTLVKRLIELHGGSVEARSEGLGKGSEFIVRLPTLPTTSADLREDFMLSDRPVSRIPRRVLVVDDNRDAADTMAIMMRIMGHIVETAYDGLEAVRLAETFRPDLVLLDIGLPKLDGYQTARMIRGEEWGRDMSLIAVTGWGQREDRRRSREAGFDYHVVKPVDPGELVRLLAAIEQRAHPSDDRRLSNIAAGNPMVDSTSAIR